MRLSVIVPTCNERDELARCLDALSEEVPSAETIVVNGPSTDGTSGMVRERADVDVLLDCASRNVNVARNLGLIEGSGDAFALLSPAYRVQAGWGEAVVESLGTNGDLVTGPVRVGEEAVAVPSDQPTDGTRIVGGNLALSESAVTALDGFDEYLMTGGARDLAQRSAGEGLHVIWHPEMSVRADGVADRHRRQHRGGYAIAWQGAESIDWGAVYRSLSYRSIKNRGVGPRVLGDVLWSSFGAGAGAAREVVGGDRSPSTWVGDGIGVGRNLVRGAIDGFRARRDDGTSARNPHGLSRSDPELVANRDDRR